MRKANFNQEANDNYESSANEVALMELEEEEKKESVSNATRYK